MSDNKPAPNSIEVMDIETTVNSDRKNKADPFDPVNRIVTMKVSAPLHDKVSLFYVEEGEDFELCYVKDTDTPTTLMGHNIKFDLHYRDRFSPDYEFNTNEQVWDTQLAEYILSGQSVKYPSLDYCAVKYGGKLKDDRLKKMWEGGTKTEDIPKHILIPYLEADVANTWLVGSRQMLDAKAQDLMPLMRGQMRGLQATKEMEMNGMHVDVDHLNTLRGRSDTKLHDLEEYIKECIVQLHGTSAYKFININSNHHVSAIFFGGEITHKERECVGKFKNGKDRFKLVERKARFSRPIEPMKSGANHNSYGYSVTKQVLKNISNQSSNNLTTDIAKLLLEYRELAKISGTYLEALNKLVYPHDECIHHNIHHTSTATGRLSSSNPNLQNQPTSDKVNVKSVFTSRFKDGHIIELDYEQLEIIALALLSNDHQLIQDIIDGRDLHSDRSIELFGSADPKYRKICKALNFGLIYGAGFKTLAANSGCSPADAKMFVRNFYDRYPGVKEWQREVKLKVELNAYPVDGQVTKLGYPARSSAYQSITGRRYTFKEYDNSYGKPGDTRFSMTETKNYPVQGLATGDIVPIMMGKLLIAVKKQNKFKFYLTNQVHDSIIIDTDGEGDLEDKCRFLKKVMEQVPEMLLENFDIETDLPFRVEIKAGPSWGNVTKVEV